MEYVLNFIVFTIYNFQTLELYQKRPVFCGRICTMLYCVGSVYKTFSRRIVASSFDIFMLMCTILKAESSVYIIYFLLLSYIFLRDFILLTTVPYFRISYFEFSVILLLFHPSSSQKRNNSLKYIVDTL